MAHHFSTLKGVKMHFYTFHIGDYLSHTSHLSPIEDLIYRRLLDKYYLSELAIPLELGAVSRLIGMREYQTEVETIIKEFFIQTESGWINKRANIELAKYHAMQAGGKKGNEIRWGKGKLPTKIPPQSPPDSPPNPNHVPVPVPVPLTGTSKPLEDPLPTRFTDEALPKYWEEFCIAERPDISPQKTFDNFRDYWIAVPGQKGKKLDWTATWRNWVRNKKFETIKSKAEPLNFTAANRRLLEKIETEERLLIVKPLELGF